MGFVDKFKDLLMMRKLLKRKSEKPRAEWKEEKRSLALHLNLAEAK